MPSLLEQLGVRAGAHEHNQAMLSAVITLVRQQKIAADMAFSIPFPVATQGVIGALGPEWPSLAISSSIASLSWFMSYRPDRDNRSQSFRKDFA